MPTELRITLGQYSDKGCKAINQDFHGACIPKDLLLHSKGIAIALADGIGTSNVSQIASSAAVKSFLEDYYCTSDAWSVKTAAQRVLTATNSWLHAQTQHSQFRFDKDRGYVCTFSAIVLKATTAHLFHIGDARIYKLDGYTLEQLTTDHRIHVSSEQHYLSRALGVDSHLEIDYRALQIEVGDIFVLLTDGVYEFVDDVFIASSVAAAKNNFDNAAKIIGEEALQRGSDDNLTVQIIRIEEIPDREAGEIQLLAQLPFPPQLTARMEFDGYTILREIHSTHRSHLYLARDNASNTLAALKVPSTDLRDNATYLENFLMEEWIARRIDNAHVMKPAIQTRKRNFLYITMEHIEGQTLAQWLRDHPQPGLESVRNIVEQVAKGLLAFHRADMLHQDIRPENIMIDTSGTAKIIDFGSARVAGVSEAATLEQITVRGALQCVAPEYFLGEAGSSRSDIFSLGVLTYQMLTGKLPYGAEVAKCRSKAAQNNLQYESAVTPHRDIPIWVDDVLKKAVHPNPDKRYAEVSEFVYDLRHPRQEFLNRSRRPLAERDPVRMWKVISLILLVLVIALLGKNLGK
jgi:serine/threonine protein kinase/serine/threonine protein phosphatase PrpC